MNLFTKVGFAAFAIALVGAAFPAASAMASGSC